MATSARRGPGRKVDGTRAGDGAGVARMIEAKARSELAFERRKTDLFRAYRWPRSSRANFPRSCSKGRGFYLLVNRETAAASVLIVV
jgi:hypothetical protein